MRIQLFSVRMLLAALMAVALAAMQSLGKYPDDSSDPHAKDEAPDSVNWLCELHPGGPAIPPHRMLAGRHDLTYLSIDNSKAPGMGLLTTGYDRRVPATDGSRPSVSVCFVYQLKVGELVPMLDALYEVTELRVGNRIRLERITNKELVQNLTDDRDLIVVPDRSGVGYLFDEDGRQLLDRCSIDVKRIAAGESKESKPTATVFVEDSIDTNPGHGLVTLVKKDFKVSIGDVLSLIKGCQLTVKKIVPPDEKHNILGWVEFDPNPPAAKKKPDDK